MRWKYKRRALRGGDTRISNELFGTLWSFHDTSPDTPEQVP